MQVARYIASLRSRLLRSRLLRSRLLRSRLLRSRLWRRKTLGELGENAAARYLQRRGFRIVARGSRSRLGELDLVAVEGRTVVFVEVKTRRSADDQHPAAAVDAEKQRRLTRAALLFLKSHRLLENRARFDVLAVVWPRHARRPSIEHFRNAFEAAGYDSFFS